jgi:outer membrane protein OmpA-like peptidoglycan-associated protein
MRTALPLLSSVFAAVFAAVLAPLLLGSCSSPPKPPSVDESLKRPANTATAVDLQACKGELHSKRLALDDKTRLAELSKQQANDLALSLALLQKAVMPKPVSNDLANVVFTVHFAFGSTALKMAAPEAAQLIEHARGAALVMLRGRTDGTADRPAESRIARDRTAAVRDYLLQSGVEATRIRSTWQPTGDHAADNDSKHGQSLNRRVEIELYHWAPQMAALSGQVQP